MKGNGYSPLREDISEFDDMKPGEVIGLVYVRDRVGEILDIYYKKLESGEKFKISTPEYKREYYIATQSGFVRCGTPLGK